MQRLARRGVFHILPTYSSAVNVFIDILVHSIAGGSELAPRCELASAEPVRDGGGLTLFGGVLLLSDAVG